MGLSLFERYVLRRLGTGFLAALASLVGVVWITRALRDLNVMTAKGQTILVFFEVVSLAVPFLIVVVTPFAILISGVAILNTMSAESELVVVAASGGNRMRILRPALIISVLAGLGSLVLTTFVIPDLQRTLREMMTSVNADLVANIIQPGRFTELDKGLVFHIRNKAGDGTLIGLMIDDRREPDERKTYLAGEAVVVEAPQSTVLVMKNGILLQDGKDPGKVTTVAYDTYGFDLSDLAPKSGRKVVRPVERSTYELIFPPAYDDPAVAKAAGRFRSELHDRLSPALLSPAFAIIAFLFLGEVRTTRQDRGMAVVGAFLTAALLRGAHFASVSASATSDVAAIACYALPLTVIVLGLGLVATDRRLALPGWIDRPIEIASAAIARLFTRRKGASGSWGTP